MPNLPQLQSCGRIKAVQSAPVKPQLSFNNFLVEWERLLLHARTRQTCEIKNTKINVQQTHKSKPNKKEVIHIQHRKGEGGRFQQFREKTRSH